MFLISVFLLGCAPVKPIIQYVDKPRFIGTPDSMLKKCVANKPPDKKIYLAAPVEEREKMLYEYANALLASIAVCNVQWTELQRWNIEQRKIYD